MIGDEAWPFVRQLINALAPTIVRLKLKTSRETSDQVQIKCVVIGIDIRRRKEYLEERRIVYIQEVLIHQSNQLVTCTALIADRPR